MNCINPLVGIPYWHQNGSFRYKVIKGAKKYFDDDSCSSLSSRLSLPVCRDPMGNIAHALLLPCGHCMACRLEYSRQWALRMCLERIHHDKENCWFLTLTYDDSHLPKTEKGVSTCRIQDVSDFMKRLRAYYSDTHNLDGIRFYAASEYGDHTFRPHYHLILYGCPVADLQPSEKFGLPAGYFCSKLLNRLWSFGNVMIGQLTFESAAYVSRYVTKKLSGNLYIEKYQKFGIEKESSRMSRNPGIGAFFFDPDIYGDIEKAVGPGRIFKRCAAFDRYMKGCDLDKMSKLKAEARKIVDLRLRSDPCSRLWIDKLEADEQALVENFSKKGIF